MSEQGLSEQGKREQGVSEPIRSSTELPARRSDIQLHTSDGLTLVGELALPEERDPFLLQAVFFDMVDDDAPRRVLRREGHLSPARIAARIASPSRRGSPGWTGPGRAFR